MPLTEKPLPSVPTQASIKVDAALADEEEPKKVEVHEDEQPTDSHVLANADHEEKGAAQADHGQTEVKDLGWSEEPADVPVPLVGGLPNKELWTLIRRFNMVCESSWVNVVNRKGVI